MSLWSSFVGSLHQVGRILQFSLLQLRIILIHCFQMQLISRSLIEIMALVINPCSPQILNVWKESYKNNCLIKFKDDLFSNSRVGHPSH